MKEIRLSAQELLYLCAMRGVKEVAGVEDVFLSVPEENLVSVVSQTRDSLVRKGCLEMDFDGNYNSVTEIDALIDAMTQSEKRIAFIMTDGAMKQYGMIYLANGSACLCERSDGLYSVRPITAEDILAYFSPAFRADLAEADQKRAVTVSAKALEGAKELFESNKKTDTKKALLEAGLDEQSAALLLASYSGNARYLGVKIDSLVPGDVYSDGLIYVSDGATAVDVRFDPFREDDLLVLDPTDAETEKERFQSLLSRLQLIPFEAEDN